MKYIIFLYLIFVGPLVYALPLNPLELIYFEPKVIEPTIKIKQQSCVDIDNAIRALHSYKYSYKPDFYEDESNKIATTLIVVDSLPVINALAGFAYLGYSSVIEEKEQRRVLQVGQQIRMLQQVKAEKHCFEK